MVAFEAREARPLVDHLEDWYRNLLARVGTVKHANLSRTRVARLVELAKARKISALTPSRIRGPLKAVRDGGRDS